MGYQSPPVVIDNGSYTTKAGFATEDLPSLVFNTNYLISGENKIVGDYEINQHPQDDVMTLMDNGLIYDFDNIVHNWQYIYDHVDNDNSIDPKEYPLVTTEQTWNTVKNKTKTCEIAFEHFQVPVFSLVKTPLTQIFRSGRSTGLVIDIGASVSSVTPILDGIIQTKCQMHSKYAGDFLNLHLMNSLNNQPGFNPSMLLPESFKSPSESFSNYHIAHNSLAEYKNLVLNYQIQSFQLPNKSHVVVPATNSNQYVQALFQPNMYRIDGVPIPDQTIDKPLTLGLTNLVFALLKSLEMQLLPNSQPQHHQASLNSKYARFNEIFKGLLSNVLITGGLSLVSGLPDHILNDLRILTPKYFPNYTYSSYLISAVPVLSDTNETWERQFGGWLGACNFANMLNDDADDDGTTSSSNIALENWFVTKADYKEMGEDLILEKFK